MRGRIVKYLLLIQEYKKIHFRSKGTEFTDAIRLRNYSKSNAITVN